MASEEEKQEWLPERTENIMSTETRTTSTGNIITTHTTSRTENSHDTNDFAETSRAENYGSIVKDDADDVRPGLHHTQTSSTEIEDEKDLRIQRIQTSRSARERRQFAPIRTGDAEELAKIATSLEGAGGSLTRTSTARGEELQRRDTLAGIDVGDSVLDPKSPDFDPYKWARM
jgi:hypothetical protein